jgi:hypothetical protein
MKKYTESALGYKGYGGAYARHKRSEGNEASGEPAQRNSQGTPGCAKAQNGKANGSGRSGKA